MVDLMVSEQQSATAGKGVPAGFKMTEVGVIPEDWDCVEIDSLISEISMGPFGSDIKVSNFVSEGVPVLNGFNVNTERLSDNFKNFVTEDKAKSLKKAVAQRGDVVVTHRGTIGQISYIPENSLYRKYVISQSQFRVRFNSLVIPSWITSYFLSNNGSEKLLEGKGHTGVPALSAPTTTFRKLKVPLPSVDEQIIINNVLLDIDLFIDKLDQLLTKKQTIKTAAMQQLLTGKVRLPQFSLRKDGSVKGYKKSELGNIPEDWNISTIGKIAPLQRGFDLPSSARKEGVYPVVYSNGIINYHNSFQVKGPGVITGRSGTIGKVHYVTDDYWPHNTSLWVTKFNNANVKFIYYLYIHIGFERFSSGSGVPTLNRNDAHDYLVLVPPIEEQTAIAAILSDMDKEIQTLQQRLDKTRQLKQGMMQELLTGKTRLI